MAYLVKLMVHINDDSVMEGRVKDAIRESGGTVKQSQCTRTYFDSKEQSLAFVIRDTRLLPRVVRAVESLRGAAVVSVTEPRELRKRPEIREQEESSILE